MKTQREDLLNRLEKEGWKVVIQDDYFCDWWASEIWHIESLWSPQDFTLWLTFLVDPQAPIHCVKHENVWAVGASGTFPSDRLEASDKLCLSLGKGWKDNASGFLSDLSRLRREAAANMIETVKLNEQCKSNEMI